MYNLDEMRDDIYLDLAVDGYLTAAIADMQDRHVWGPDPEPSEETFEMALEDVENFIRDLPEGFTAGIDPLHLGSEFYWFRNGHRFSPVDPIICRVADTFGPTESYIEDDVLYIDRPYW